MTGNDYKGNEMETIDIESVRDDVQVLVKALRDVQMHADKGQAGVNKAREACQRLDRTIGPNLYTDETIEGVLCTDAKDIEFLIQGVPGLLSGWRTEVVGIRFRTLVGWLEKLTAHMGA